MRFKFVPFLLLTCSVPLALRAQDAVPSVQGINSTLGSDSVAKLPTGTLLLKGAWWSASDSTTAIPETGTIVGSTFSNPYFGISWTLPADWYQQYTGPPPSERGRYVLAQFTPTSKGSASGSVLITAEDLFFTPIPAADTRQLVDFQRDHLDPAFKVEAAPADIKIAGRSFRFFSYNAPASELHWYILATQIRCHIVEFIFTGRDPELLETLKQDMNSMTIPTDADSVPKQGAGAPPVCLKDYARDENLTARVTPIFYTSRFSPMPVRLIIDKDGNVKHIHVLSAFPDQSRSIYDALAQWKFKPYLRDGHAVEVETGIMFGHANLPSMQAVGIQGSR